MDGHLGVDDLVDATRQLVTVESPTDDLTACAEVVEAAHELSRAWLSEPGRIERHGDRPVWRWGPSSPRVLLLGHLDTVWPVGTLERIPFAVDGDRMTGPGVFDM